MKRPVWVNIASVVGMVFFCCGVSGLCSTFGLDLAFVPPAAATALPIIPPALNESPVVQPSIEPSQTPTLETQSAPTMDISVTPSLSPTESPIPTDSPTQTLTPTITVIYGFEMLSYSETVSVGGSGYANIKTNPGASCSIAYYTPAGTHSTAQGLEPQKADSEGSCSWSWKIGSRTKPGKGRIVITANNVSKEFPITVA